jgi:hypothetical protein
MKPSSVSVGPKHNRNRLCSTCPCPRPMSGQSGSGGGTTLQWLKAVGRLARIRRFLASKWIISRTLYQPIIEEVLQAWAGREVTIVLVGCFIRNKALQILRVSLCHCYRALPLAWEVVTDKGNVELEVCKTMLEHVAKLVGRMRRVTFLADRGFRSREWARKCQELDWDYIIRLATSTIITFHGGVQRPLDQLGVKKGERRYLPNVQSRWKLSGHAIWRSPGRARRRVAQPNSAW